MRTSVNRGFTIIEVMLFLGISGILVVAILVGTGTSINAQRYRDATSSLKAFFQQQYADVASVNNSRGSNWTCDENANVSVLSSGSVNRGQSDCVILGKIITTVDNQTLLIRDVVGRGSYGSSLQADLSALRAFNLKPSPILTQNYIPEWDVTMTRPGTNNPVSFTVLILRSPSSGVIRTFINPSNVINDNQIVDLLSEESLQQSLSICVNPTGISLGAISAVHISSNGTSANAVEIMGEELNEC